MRKFKISSEYNYKPTPTRRRNRKRPLNHRKKLTPSQSRQRKNGMVY